MIEELFGDDAERSGAYLAEFIYGANDGIVTTFAVVSGVAGAALNPSIVVVLGVANLLADGFSMGMSNYLSRRSELDYRAAADDVEESVSEAEAKSPASTALATFLAFVVAGWTPLLPYVVAVGPLFELSVVVTAVAFFVVGASRSLVTERPWPHSGAEMLAIGLIAAAVAYTAGAVLGGVAR